MYYYSSKIQVFFDNNNFTKKDTKLSKRLSLKCMKSYYTSFTHKS